MLVSPRLSGSLLTTAGSTTITATTTVTTLPSCPSGSAFCQDACLDVLTDPTNCGKCGNVCPSLPNSSPTCSLGTCGYVCNPGFIDCDLNPANGCEVSVLNDLQNCGSCGAVCLNPINYPGPGGFLPFQSACINGVCSYGCVSGAANCTGPDEYGNPCPIELEIDASNCGSCGNVCSVVRPNAQPGTCLSGNCYSLCETGYGDCDGNFTNGCETYVFTDINNCDSCGHICPSAPNSSPTCSYNGCGFQCDSGYANCNGNPATGCETYIYDDLNNCGSCGNVCSYVPYGSPTCVSEECSFQCYQGYANCDGNFDNGCEASLLTDRYNCGSCGYTVSFQNPNSS